MPESVVVYPPGRRMQSPPLVSVCIANFNGSEYVDRCIQSVLDQSSHIEMEIILHDDASIDDSVDKVRKQFPQVEIISSADNVGFCVSNNRMAASARGKYLLLLNNDAELRPGAICSLIDYATQQPKPGILGLAQYDMHSGSLIDRGYELDIFINPIPVYRQGTKKVASVTGACLWIPRDLWEVIGGFPPWFESVAEDMYLCCATRLLGYSVEILAEPGFDHWVGRNLGGGKVVDAKLSSTVRRRALTETNKTSIMLVCYPMTLLILVMPLHALFLGVEALVMLTVSRKWNLFKRIYLNLPYKLWRDRHEIQRLRNRLFTLKTCGAKDFFSKFRFYPWKLVMLFRYGLPTLKG